MKYFVEVVPPGEAGIRHEVSLGSGTLGTGPNDVVRLPGGSIVGPSALRLSVSSEGVHVKARDSSSAFTYQGKSQLQGSPKWGEEIYLGTTRLGLVVEQSQKKGASPILVVASIFALLFAVGSVLRLVDTGFIGDLTPEPPTIATAEVSCRAASADAARARGQEAQALGLAKEERYPFSRGDGVRALRLYGEAKSCFQKAGLQDEEAHMRARHESWAHRIDRDFRDLRLRLDIALRDKDAGRALEAVSAIERMLSAAGKPLEDDYKLWLSRTKLRLQAQAPQRN